MPKKVKIVKTPGFAIEVPQERRKTFFVRPKAPLEYWAFKNRPRVFINEPLYFTFNGKPVAQAVVVKVEAPGNGEGEYKHWHKVYWKPTSFKRFKVVTAKTKLYHGSRVKFKSGDILTPQPGGYVQEAEGIERIMENCRPEGSLPRKDSVFMVSHPNEIESAGGYEDYVYEVEPIGKVEKGDLGWYGDVSVYGEYQPDDPEVIQAAKSYWAGEPHDGPSLWEYRAPKAKVIRLVSSSKTALLKPKETMKTAGDLLEDPDYYMVEGCGIYALDFARKNGGEIYILSAVRGEEWSEEIPYEVTHAFVKRDGKTYDIRGERTPDKMAWELSMGEYTVKGPWTPDEFEAKFVGETDDKPLYGKTGAAKLPKGWKVTLKKDKDGFYSGHIWKDGQFYQQCGVASEYADKAREAAIEWAWQASGQKPDAAVKTNPMDPEWAKRLDETLAEGFEKRPDLLKLRTKLLSFGGGEALIKDLDNPPAEVERLMTRGQFWKGRGTKFKKMRPNNCHGNSVCLMEEGIGSVVNGYALSVDGLWRQHSWIITPDGGLIETTKPRAAYFGAVLKPEEVKAEYDYRYASKTAEDKVIDVGDGDEYWAGEGNAASGVLPVCPSKGTVCLAWRSSEVMSPNCWGTVGGAVKEGMSPQESAKVEMAEEAGYHGGITLVPAFVFTDRGFKYHNFIGIVVSEFSFSPAEGFGWETDHIAWVPYQDVLEDMKANSGDYHPGLIKLFQNSQDVIERALKITKTAAHNPSCKCEMCRSIPAWKRPWLTGKCHEFALALAGTMPDAQFVGIGGGMFEHVGLRKGDTYYDVRGAMTKDQFTELFGSNANSIRDVSREEVLKDSFPSYIGHEDELVETSDLKSALKAVRRVFSKTASEKFSAYYHGTNEDFKEFKSPEGVFYFTTNRRYAEFFADRAIERHGGDENQKIVHEVELDIKKPFDARRFKLKKLSIDQYAAALNVPEETFYEKYEDGTMVGTMRKMPFWRWFRLNEKESKKALQSQGYDGLIQKETSAFYEGYGATSYVVFSPSQIHRTKYAASVMDSRKPCPSGKRKFFDEVSATGPHKQWDPNTPALRAYKCPKCGWFHLTSKPQKFAVQTHMFPSSQDAKFKAWFDGSKVVDKNGNPMPVYHGTRSSVDFEEFSVEGPPYVEDEERTTSSGSGGDPTAYLGAHFAEEPNVAGMFAEGKGWTSTRYEGEQEKPRVVKVYLRITNPKDFGSELNLRNFINQGKITDDDVLQLAQQNDGIQYWDEDEATQKALEDWYNKYDNDQNFRVDQNTYLFEYHNREEGDEEALTSAAYDLARNAKQRLTTAGYDGVRYKNVVEGGTAWIAFEPNQIKSAYAQQFNPRDPRFTASKAAGEFDEADRFYEESVANEGKAPENRALYEGKPFWSGIADVADGSIIEVHTYEEADRAGFHHSFYVSSSSQQMMREGDYAFFWVDKNGVQVEWPTANQDTKILVDLTKRISRHIQFRKTAGSHTMEYAQNLIKTLKQTVHEADFKVIGSVGTGKESDNDLDIMVNLHPDAVFEDKDWIESSGLLGAMKLMGFDYEGPSEFSPEESAEKSEISGKYLDPQGSSVEKFFNPTTMHTVEFWFTESGMPKEAAQFPTQTAPQPSTTEHPDLMYHYGGPEDRASIQKKGLLGSMSSALENAVFLDSKFTPESEGKYTDVWEVNVKGLELDPDWTTDISDRPEWAGRTWWIFYGDIPPKRLKLVHKGTMAKDASWAKRAAGFAFKSFKKLWHVGTMNPKDKRDDSYEGAGLSVSVNPDEWQQIAKIGGDLWELTKPSNRFVNFHRLSKAQREQIVDWGIKNGYALPAELWRHSWYDDELEDWRYSDYSSKEEAEGELGSYEEEKVEPVKGGLTATPKLSQKSKRGKIDPIEVVDLLVTAYAEDELDCDGVWWADDLDPDNLSAPRGVIFPSKLKTWKARKAQKAAYDPARAAQFSIKVMNHPTNSSIFEVRAYGDEGWAGTVSVVQKGEDFYVSQSVLPPSTQGIGLGSRLYAWAMDEAENRGGKRFWSDTEVSQDATKIWDRLPSVEFDEKSGRYYTPLGKTANKLASAVQPFYHGTTWAAADKIDKEGLKAHKWQFGPESYVWASILPQTGHSYGLSSSDEDDYAVVTFLWDYDKTEPDPEHEGDTDVYRRIPSNVPRSVIKKIEYFDWDGNLVKTTASSKTAAEWKKLPATDEWVAKAKVFLKEKWEQRHKELGREGVPTDLAGACKFASMFAQKLFGGRMVGTAEHQALKLSNGRMLDLTDIYNPNTFKHDKEFWMNPEHEESMKSCEPRVQQWVDEFYHKYWQDYFKTNTAARMETYLYHGTNDIALAGILEKGMPAGSYWGISSVAEYFAKGASEEEGNPVILRIPMNRFDKSKLAVDQVAIAEPLTLALGIDEDTLYEEWEKVPGEGTWEDCLRIYGAVKYMAPMKITKADVWM